MFKNTWNELAIIYFKPNNFVEDIGGGPRMKKIIH